MYTLFLIAIRNLIQNRKRTLLLGTAIAMVTTLLVMLSALFNGMQETMLRTSTTLMTGHVNVAGFYKVTSGTAAPVVTKYAKLRDIVSKATPDLKAVVVRGRGWGKVVSDTTSLQAALVGVDITNEVGFKDVVQVLTGSVDALKDPHTALIFKAQAERLEVKVGDILTLSAPSFRGVTNTVDVKIVAIAKDLGFLSSFNVFLHHDAIRDLYQLDSAATGAIQVYLKDAEKADEVAALLRKEVEKQGYRVMDKVAMPFFRKFDTVRREDWVGQKIDITTWIDEMQFIRMVLTTLSWLIRILVGVLMVIIVIGVMNTLWMSIRERTREIGTVRAIGMSWWRVMAMFVIEAALLSIAATVVGAVLATLLCAGMNAAQIVVAKQFQLFLMSDTLHLLVDGPTLAWSILIIVVGTTLGSLYPSWRAANMRPVVAMQAA